MPFLDVPVQLETSLDINRETLAMLMSEVIRLMRAGARSIDNVLLLVQGRASVFSMRSYPSMSFAQLSQCR